MNKSIRCLSDIETQPITCTSKNGGPLQPHIPYVYRYLSIHINTLDDQMILRLHIGKS